MTYRLTQAGYPLVVLNKVEIRHMERHKSALDKLFL
jgi:GT2 family glycosyltransferase